MDGILIDADLQEFDLISLLDVQAYLMHSLIHPRIEHSLSILGGKYQMVE